VNLHKNQFPNTNPRLADYLYKGWKVCHYTLPPEQFIAQKGARCLRADTQIDIEKKIDS